VGVWLGFGGGGADELELPPPQAITQRSTESKIATKIMRRSQRKTRRPSKNKHGSPAHRSSVRANSDADVLPVVLMVRVTGIPPRLGITLEGLKLQVAPVGSPEQES